jgi:peptide/nickel transport system permease protein
MLLQIKNFKFIMSKIMKNRKSAAGVIILVFFSIIAMIGPLFATSDPIRPGGVLYGKMPIAGIRCVPEWYPEVTGNMNFTKNIYVNPDPKLSDPTKLRLWKNSTTDGVFVNYNTSFGYDDSACLEITFTKEGNATLSIEFDYLYKIPPQKFMGEYNYIIKSQNSSEISRANFTIFNTFSYEGLVERVYKNASLPLTLQIVNQNTWNLVPYSRISSTNYELSAYYGEDPAGVIFKKPRKYSFDIIIVFTGNATELGNPEILIDNVNVVLFGNAFGLFGTDQEGRDIFTQLIVGTRISFIIGIVSAMVSIGIGLIVGLIAGYVGRAMDEVLMRFTDMLLVIPTLPLLLVLVYVMGQTMFNIILVVGILGWMGFARIVRSATLSLKERPFIEAVKAAGGGRLYIIRKHIVPNVMPLIYITLAMSVPSAIVSEAALSWLGLAPMDVMSWGRILHEFERSGSIATGAFSYWYWTIPPGISIALLSIAFVLIGYALDEILNPKLRER